MGAPLLAASESAAGTAQPTRPAVLIVEEGQTLWQIAANYGVSVETLLQANGLRPTQVLRVGQRLSIPPAAEISDQTSAAASQHPASWHVVGEGETLWMIAQRYGVSVESLANANDVTDEDLIHPGLKLAIPSSGTSDAGKQTSAPSKSTGSKKAAVAGPSTTIVVEPGETLWSIAQTHSVSVDTLVAVNHLSSAEYIRAGQRVIIPGAGAVVPRLRQGTGTIPEPPPPIHSNFAAPLLWPSRGIMTSGFGWRRSHHHNGIDIAAPRGTPIVAAVAGKVIFTGWYGGYGLAVILDHGDGLITLYGHASKIVVQVGDEVNAGETVALIGCTGVCTGPHLHFEVRVDGRPSNPLQYLP